MNHQEQLARIVDDLGLKGTLKLLTTVVESHGDYLAGTNLEHAREWYRDANRIDAVSGQIEA